MVQTKKQKQAQKEQEQLVSQALAQAAPKTSHLSFDDEDDDAPEAVSAQPVVAKNTAVASDDDENDDDSAPIEVVSNKVSRKRAAEQTTKLKAQEREARAKRQENEKKRAEQKKKEEVQTLPLSELTEKSEEAASGSSRLDPSLFAEVFSRPVTAKKSILKRRTAEEEADSVAKAQADRKKRRKAQRSGGVVLGRDGLPMKRADDGTIIRALETTAGRKITSFDTTEAEEREEPLDTVVRPTPLDPSLSRPNAKARAYKKRHLEKKGLAQHKPSVATKAIQKSEDDPLGLNDPAFLPGGEYYHLVNKNKSKSGTKGAGVPGKIAKEGFRGGGARKEAVSVLRSRSRAGPSLGFARSQAGTN